MHKKVIYLCLLVPLLFVNVSSAESVGIEIKPKTEWTKDEVRELVDYYADKHKVSRATLHFVINCESGYNHKAFNGADRHRDSIGSLGVAQFATSTFNSFANKMGEDYDDPYNPEQALDVASWAISKGYGRHWTCFRKL